MYLLIAGDEKYKLYTEVVRRVKKILEDVDLKTVTILECGDEKFDKLVRQLAVELGVKTIQYKIDWDKYGKQAAYKRNQSVTLKATNAIFFWKGDKTDKVKTLINACEENNVKTRVIKVVIDECEGKDNKAHKQQAK